MTSKKALIESEKQTQERLAEIGRILCAGIKRIEVREASENNLNQLDSKTVRSLHNIDSNLYQKAML